MKSVFDDFKNTLIHPQDSRIRYISHLYIDASNAHCITKIMFKLLYLLLAIILVEAFLTLFILFHLVNI